jgi:hypothetical protein
LALSTRIEVLGAKAIASRSAITLHGTGIVGTAIAAGAAIIPPVTAAATAAPPTVQRAARRRRPAGANAPRPGPPEPIEDIRNSPLSLFV